MAHQGQGTLKIDLELFNVLFVQLEVFVETSEILWKHAEIPCMYMIFHALCSQTQTCMKF